MLIETSRLYLRESTSDDAALAYRLNLNPEVIRYTGDPPFISEEEARSFLSAYDAFRKYGMGRWYAFRKVDNGFVGWCGLKFHPEDGEVDLGYRLLEEEWGKGYATEAALACLEYGFESLDLNSIIAMADIRNPASIRVMEKIGMLFESNVKFDDDQGVMYRITKENWSKR